MSELRVLSIEEEMLREEPTETAALPPSAPPPGMDDYAKAMMSVAESVKALVENQTITRQLSMSEIKPVTPWNPEGKRNRKTLQVNFFQHGFWANPMTMSEEEMALVMKLKPGRYLNRRVEVQKDQDGNIHLNYPWETIRERMENMLLWSSLTDLCQQIIKEREEKEAKRKLGQFDPEEVLN